MSCLAIYSYLRELQQFTHTHTHTHTHFDVFEERHRYKPYIPDTHTDMNQLTVCVCVCVCVWVRLRLRLRELVSVCVLCDRNCEKVCVREKWSDCVHRVCVCLYVVCEKGNRKWETVYVYTWKKAEIGSGGCLVAVFDSQNTTVRSGYTHDLTSICLN